MKHIATHPIVKSRFHHIGSALAETLILFDTEDIHIFRVEVKKLRAFLHLTGGTRQLRIPGDLHKFYTMAGKIRNLNLQQQRIREAIGAESQLPQSYLQLLHDEASAACHTAAGYAKKKIFLKSQLEKLIHRLPAHLDKRDIRHFISHTDETLRTSIALAPPLSDDTWHDLRKCLKDLQYNFSFVKKSAVQLLPAALLEKKGLLHLLTEALGHYQDLRTGLLFLEPVRLQKLQDEKEKALLLTIRTRWEEEKQSAGVRLHALLHTLFTPTSGHTMPDAIALTPPVSIEPVPLASHRQSQSISLSKSRIYDTDRRPRRLHRKLRQCSPLCRRHGRGHWRRTPPGPLPGIPFDHRDRPHALLRPPGHPRQRPLRAPAAGR